MTVAVLRCCGQGEFLGMMQVMGTSLVTIHEHLSHWREVKTVMLCRAACL